jgi:hypothetical protein
MAISPDAITAGMISRSTEARGRDIYGRASGTASDEREKLLAVSSKLLGGRRGTGDGGARRAKEEGAKGSPSTSQEEKESTEMGLSDLCFLCFLLFNKGCWPSTLLSVL